MKNIANNPIGYVINNEIHDLHDNFDKNIAHKEIFRNSSEGLHIIRHSCAHIMAQAIKSIYKNVHFAIGPVTEDGFFYDFQIFDDNNNKINLSLNDLIAIEELMHKFIDQDLKFTKNIFNKNDFCTSDVFKEKIISKIDSNQISTYTQGDFVDICKGPHVLSSEIIGHAFKLNSISEVTWSGVRLQRIEGIAFLNKEDLENFELNKQIQEQNDHRKLGKSMKLFSFSNLSPGFVFWHPKGLFLIEQIKKIIRQTGYKNFEEYETPYIFKKELYEKTGHLQNYSENMFILDDCCLKPMNCPGHALIFQEKAVSYKDLPVKIAEFGSCFRNEEQGGLMGIKRTKRLTIDDGHIFCSFDQIESEIINFLDDAKWIYNKFGFKNMMIKLATRPIKRIGSEEFWDEAENILKNALKNEKYILAEGDGAFYGPKIELHLVDNMDRSWQCGTIQVDFFLAERLNIYYIDSNGNKKSPIILHRAIVGSIERFIGVLLENGPLPTWIDPIHVAILPISKKFEDYSTEIYNILSKNNIRCILNINEDRIDKKIKCSIEEKIKYCIIIGQNEVNNKNVTLRYNNENTLLNINEVIDIFSEKSI